MSETPFSFDSHGSRCAATLYLPQGVERPPVLVMAHGFGAVRQAGLPDYARRFASTGWAVLLFDYRGFGDSDGQPRQWVNVGRQLDDWRAAIACVRRLSCVNGGRLALWGYSFSGGHVIQLAAEMGSGLLGVLSMAPHLSGFAGLGQVAPLTLVRLTLAGMSDLLCGAFGRHRYVQTIGRAKEPAALASDDAWEAYEQLCATGVQMDNRVRARIALELPQYNPLKAASRVRVPTLIMAGDIDSVTPARFAQRAAQRIDGARYASYHGRHFDPLFAPLRERIWVEQTAFLQYLAAIGSRQS